LVNNEKFCGKELFIAAGRYTSFHWHEIKEEMLYVQEGVLGLIWRPPDKTIGYSVRKIYSGGGFYATPKAVHQLYAVEGDLTIIETSSQHFDEDSYQETMDLMHSFDYTDDFR
jgi:oxalate decarboxylase/phosphoglucose isomerase-like protein (cupin superfamily)